MYNQPFTQGPADITNAGGLSPYGVMGMGGNVSEWEETESDLVNNSPSSARGVRGGEWGSNSNSLSASNRSFSDPTIGSLSFGGVGGFGFRVASIPEPSSAVLLTLATVGLWQRRKRLA